MSSLFFQKVSRDYKFVEISKIFLLKIIHFSWDFQSSVIQIIKVIIFSINLTVDMKIIEAIIILQLIELLESIYNKL